jgi:hypothetical protein
LPNILQSGYNKDKWYEFFPAMMLLYVASLARWQHEERIQRGNNNRGLWVFSSPEVQKTVSPKEFFSPI